MEGKKETAVEPKKTSPSTQVFDFVGEVKSELGRISWTSPEELRLYVKAVVGSTLFFGIGVYLVDLAIQATLRGLGTVIRAIIG